MKKKSWLLLMLPFVIACSSELRVNSSPEAPRLSETPNLYVIKVTPNQKYKLEAIFSGYDVDVGERKVPVIQQLTIRSSETGQQVEYSRSDGPSESDASAYFTDVWSPDDELLLLPLDRFK